MGAFVTGIKAIIGGDPIDGISKIIQDFKLPPEAKIQEQEQLAQLALQHDTITAARDEALAQANAAAANDPTWKKAHAYFVYVVDIALALNIVIIPLWNHFAHLPITYVPLPADVMHLFEITFVSFAGVIHGPDIISAIGGKK